MNDYEKQYLYFDTEEELLGLSAFPLILSDTLVIYVHRVLGDGALNWLREYSAEEVLKEKERIVSLGMPDNEFFSMEELMERLHQFLGVL